MPNDQAADAGNIASPSAVNGDAGFADDLSPHRAPSGDAEAEAQDAACNIEPDDVPGCIAELGKGGVSGLNKKVPRRFTRKQRTSKPRRRQWGRF